MEAVEEKLSSGETVKGHQDEEDTRESPLVSAEGKCFKSTDSVKVAMLQVSRKILDYKYCTCTDCIL